MAISDLDTGELRDPPLNWTLRRWLHSSEPRPVTIDDVRRHMKSVIPPVRACGRLELRMIDTQPGDDWLVPLIVVSTLLDDPSACQEISELAHEMPDPPLRRHYIAAALDGLRLPELAGWARQSFEIVTNAVAGAGLPRKALAVLESFAERIGYTDSSVQFGAGVGARDAA